MAAASSAEPPRQEQELDAGAPWGWVLAGPEGQAEAPDAMPTEPPAHLGLRVEVATEFPAVCMEPTTLQAVVSVVAPPADDTTRAPLRLVAVLDKSGSMNGRKLELVRRTMLFMLSHLSDQDALGLVAYDSDVRVLAPLTRCTGEGRARLEAVLRGLRAGTQTNLSGGMLRGLELHREGVVESLQQARFGNLYRHMSDEEALERAEEHFGIEEPPRGAARVHEWTMELRLDSQDAALVEKVVYTLHETFKERVVEVSEPPFALRRFGWGTFTVFAEVHLRDGRVLRLEHELAFGAGEHFRTLLLPLRAAAAEVPGADVADAHPVVAGEGLVRSTFLFTDGLANVGIRSREDLGRAALAALGELGACRCSLSTFGFGADHDADLLKDLAATGEGIYCYVEDEDHIGEAFGEALGGLLTTTHQNVRLTLDLQPGVDFKDAFTPYTVHRPGSCGSSSTAPRAAVIEFGDLFAEERRDVLLTLALPAAEADGPQVLGRLSAKGFSVQRCRTEEAASVAVEVARQAADGAEAKSHPQVVEQRNRRTATRALQQARTVATSGDLAGARRLLDDAVGDLLASPLVVAGDADSLGLLTDLQDCRRDLAEEASYVTKGSKKMNSLGLCYEQQRACGKRDGGTTKYQNKMMANMKANFKGNVK